MQHPSRSIHASHEGTKIGRSNNRIADQFDKVIDDDHSPPLLLHASIIQGACRRGENSEAGCSNFEMCGAKSALARVVYSAVTHLSASEETLTRPQRIFDRTIHLVFVPCIAAVTPGRIVA
jgi:hypothetical protein